MTKKALNELREKIPAAVWAKKWEKRKMEKKQACICSCKDCSNKATKIFGSDKICEDCYIKCAYDMKPLIMEEVKNED